MTDSVAKPVAIAPGLRPTKRVDQRLRMRGGIETLLLLMPALLLVLGLFVYPLLYGIDLSLHADPSGKGSQSLDNYLFFFGYSPTTDQIAPGTASLTIGGKTYAYSNQNDQMNIVWVTFEVALPVTLFSVAISIPLAYYMRRGIRFERLITTLLILPITLGTVMVGTGMLIYFGRQGWFNQALQAIGLIRQPLTLVHNVLGVQIALFIQGFPFVFLLILGYMSGISPDLERASRMLGSSAWRTFWRIIFPLTLPGVAIAFCLNFVANFSVFPSAQIVGEPQRLTPVISLIAYRNAYDYQNPPMGVTIALIMALIELLVVGFVLWMRGAFTRGATLGGGKGV